MAQPPKATPHSDIDGVRRDEKSNVDSAIEAGQDGEDLARAKEQSRGRPPHTDEDGAVERSR